MSLKKVCPEVVERFELFRSLEPNWDGYQGKPPDTETLDFAYTTLVNLHLEAERRGLSFPCPQTSCGGSGMVQFDWSIGNGVEKKEMELEFLFHDGVVYFEYLLCPTPNPRTWEEELNLTGNPLEHYCIETLFSWIEGKDNRVFVDMDFIFVQGDL
jgi:hypothetical protein